MGANLHITLTEMRNESRVVKQTNSLRKLDSIDSVFIASLWGEGLGVSENYNDVKLTRFKLITRKFGMSMIAQVFKYIEFLLRVYFHYKSENVKIITVHSLALLPIGCLLKIIYSAKLVYDAHELETEKNGLKGVRKKLSILLEKQLIRWVDHTVVVSNSIAKWYKSHYSLDSVSVVFNAPVVRKVERQDLLRKELGIAQSSKIFIYQGLLSSGRGIEELLEVFGNINEDVALVFMGYGSYTKRIMEAASSSSRIYFFPAVDPSEVLDYSASADIGISFIEPVCLSYDYCMPNKVFEYLTVGLPVVTSNCVELVEFVKEHSVGWHTNHFTVNELKKVIQSSLNDDIFPYRDRCYETANKFAWQNQELKLLEVYQCILR